MRAWDLLRDAREAYGSAVERDRSRLDVPRSRARSCSERAYESLLAAEGSDWNWWYGPEHGSANDAEFDALYRKHLTGIYNALGEQAPDELGASDQARAGRRERSELPVAYLDVTVDGRESSYFEWLGAGFYATDRRTSAMHGRVYVFGDFYYGFGAGAIFLRVDPVAEAMAEIPDFQMRLTMWDSRETRLTLRVEKRKLAGCIVEQAGLCLLRPERWLCRGLRENYRSRPREGIIRFAAGRRELLLSVHCGKAVCRSMSCQSRNAEHRAGRRKFRVGDPASMRWQAATGSGAGRS